VLAAALMLVLATAGCGGEDQEAANSPPPPAKPEDFPKVAGKTLANLRKQVNEEGPVLAPSVSELGPGTNRFGFGLFDRARSQIADAPVAVYVAKADGGAAEGPFPARYESLAVEAPFHSRLVEADPDAAKALYVARIKFPKPGSYEVMGIARLDNRLVAATPAGAALKVSKDGGVPDVGDAAPLIHTPTKTDVAGDISKIDTRQPPSTMHDVDFADVVGKRPVILLFATPALCRSRVCGPVVDVAEQVKARRGKDAAFIHMEIFRNNDFDQGYRPQVVKWKLPTEPWLFAIDSQGKVAARIEGAFSAEELNKAVDAAVKGGQ
jgi:hypothetical protein